MDNLLKEAIADAKAVRETALANAKIALEEAFTPKLQRMLSAKLAQEDGEPEAAEDEDLEEQGDPEAMEDTSDLPAEESGDEAYEDDGVEDGMSEDEVDENDDMEEPMEDTPPMGEGEEAEEDEDLEEDEAPAEEDEEAYEDDELDLEAIIRELEADAEEDEEPVEEQSDSSDIGEDDNVVEPAEGDDEEKDETDDSSAAPGEENEDDEVVDDLDEGEEAEEDEEPLDLESIIKELEDEMEGEEAEEDEEPAEESAKAKLAKVNADLAEHRKVVRYLSSKLHEVNLLNAKLLYTNKLFRAHSLKENQKLRVIETFDRAKNLREVKLVFTTMAESFGSTPGKKRRMTESAASRPTASTKPSRKVITEGQVLANRFKKLAGIK